MNPQILLNISPLIANVVCSLVTLSFFAYKFGGLSSFFAATRGSDADLIVLVLMLLVNVVFSLVLSLLSIILFARGVGPKSE